jgi:hypothetical protein
LRPLEEKALMIADLEDLRDRLNDREKQVLDRLVSTDRPRLIETLSVQELADSIENMENDEVRDILRMFSDLELVELRDDEKTVRARAAAILAARDKLNTREDLERKLGRAGRLAGQAWLQLGNWTRFLAKLAGGLIGVALVGQLAMGIYYMIWLAHVLSHWWQTGQVLSPGG